MTSPTYAAPSTSSKRARQPSPLRSPVPKKRRDLPWDDDSPPDDDGDEKVEDEDLEALLPPESTPHATWQETACEVALAMLESEPAMATRLLDVTMGGEPTTGRSKGPVPSVELWNEGLEKYRRGRVCLTRTPGRKEANTPNCVKLSDLWKPEAVLGGMISTMYLSEDFLVKHIMDPENPHTRRDTPIYVSRDIKFDRLKHVAAAKLGIKLGKSYVSNDDSLLLALELFKLHQQVQGSNWRAAYPYTSGTAHSKVMIIRYTAFLLLVITSCNFIREDCEGSDNHWFIMAFPEKATLTREKDVLPFERALFQHINELDTPNEFIDAVYRRYDFSATVDRVHLVVSERGTTDDPHKYGLLRLSKLVRELLPLEVKARNVELEICTASLGNLADEWIKQVQWLLTGRSLRGLLRRIEKKTVGEMRMLTWRIVYPSQATVKKVDEEVQQIAVEMGCQISTKIWPTAKPEVKSMFHDYISKDPGRLFHQKLILWLPKANSSSPSSASSSSYSSSTSSSSSTSTSPPDPSSSASSLPYLIYLGSHNFSKNAWGIVTRRYGKANISGYSNYELGVVMKGEQLAEMFEGGSSWEDAITYERPARRYGEGDRPFNSALRYA